MPCRQPPFGPRHARALPRLWLFTDERIADAALLRAISRLPRGSGVVFRHYGLGRAERRALFAAVAVFARRRGLMLLAVGEVVPGRGADGVHRPAHGRTRARARSRTGIVSATVHTQRDMAAARRARADILFLSPVFPTRSHPGGRTLGLWRFAALARRAHCPVIALGGITEARFRRLKPLGACGWAAIDALS